MGGAAIIGIGAGVQAYSTYQGYQSARTSAKYLANINRQNAAIIDAQKKDVITTGKKAEKRLERETVEFIGDQVTAFAASGIDISSAVVGEVTEQTARTGAADIIELQQNIKREVWGLEVGKRSELAEANLNKYKARQAKRAGVLSIATGATQIYGSTLTPKSPLVRTSPRGAGLLSTSRNTAINFPRFR